MNGTALKIQQGDCIYISIDAHISTMSIFIAVFYHQSHLSHAIKSHLLQTGEQRGSQGWP